MTCALAEWDDNAVEVYKANFPEANVWHGDIADLGVDEALAIANIEIGELDILDGSPPCQGFSFMIDRGRKTANDPRNSGVLEEQRLIEGMQPKTFIMENVGAMVKGHLRANPHEAARVWIRGQGEDAQHLLVRRAAVA